MTTQHAPFHITAGLPFGKKIVVTLPAGRSFWLNENQFEVLGQIRITDDFMSELILDISKYMTVTFDPGEDPDIVTIYLNMNSSNTRLVTAGGYYDIIMSDPLELDNRAARLVEGPVFRQAVVTSDKETIGVDQP